MKEIIFTIMQLNIIKFIKDINYKKRELISTFFTPFPNYIYNLGTNSGNFAITGVGLGLIKCQRLFWISNIGIVFLFLFKNKFNLLIYYLLVCLCIYLILQSFLYAKSLITFLKIKPTNYSTENIR